MQSAGQPGDNDVVMPLNAAGHYILAAATNSTRSSCKPAKHLLCQLSRME
jgi:hypothetical protein